MLPLGGDGDIEERGIVEHQPNIAGLSLIDKEDVIKKKKSKRERYGYLKGKIAKLVPWIYSEIDREGNLRREIYMRARDVAKDLGLENKSDAALYSGLRFLLYYEGISVHIKNNGEENLFTMSKLVGGDGFPKSILKTFDNMELDDWYIKRQHDFLSTKHSITKEYHKDIGCTYILESEGNICFDRRNLTEEQALEFVKYMSSTDMHAPDFVYLTPINVTLNDQYLRNTIRLDNFDENTIGREFRIVKSEDCFAVTSIYGKECEINEFEIDSIIKGCNVYSILSSFDNITNVEKVPERIDILNKILPGIKSKNIVILQGKKLIVTNSIGVFHISLTDGILHKIYDTNTRPKYICVGSMYNKTEGFIVYNGNKYDIDSIMNTVLSKLNMLLEEKYPDGITRRQILT